MRHRWRWRIVWGEATRKGERQRWRVAIESDRQLVVPFPGPFLAPRSASALSLTLSLSVPAHSPPSFLPAGINGKSLLLSFKRPATLLISNFGRYLYLLQPVSSVPARPVTQSLLSQPIENHRHSFYPRAGSNGAAWKKKENRDGRGMRKKKKGKRAIGAFLDALAFDRTPPRFRSANRDVFYLKVGE